MNGRYLVYILKRVNRRNFSKKFHINLIYFYDKIKKYKYKKVYYIIMSSFEIDNNDMSLLMVKYKNLYLKELTYYGTSETDQMFILIVIGQEISILENILVNQFYNKFVKQFLSNTIEHDINLYNTQKILFCSFDILMNMVMLCVLNSIESEEFELKSRYLVGSIENFVEKILNPIMSKLNLIMLTNKIFKVDTDIQYLKKFILLNKHKFTSKEKLKKLDLFIKLTS